MCVCVRDASVQKSVERGGVDVMVLVCVCVFLFVSECIDGGVCGNGRGVSWYLCVCVCVCVCV